jgi:predicted nucleotidyltransferase
VKTPAEAQAIITQMVQRIVERFHPEKIILFGSYARGAPGPDSDVDLLVVLRADGSKHDRTVEIYQALGATGLPKDVIVVSPEDVERYRDIPGAIIWPALREGTVLYERAA